MSSFHYTQAEPQVLSIDSILFGLLRDALMQRIYDRSQQVSTPYKYYVLTTTCLLPNYDCKLINYKTFYVTHSHTLFPYLRYTPPPKCHCELVYKLGCRLKHSRILIAKFCHVSYIKLLFKVIKVINLLKLKLKPRVLISNHR